MRVFVYLIAGLAIIQGLWLVASETLVAWPGRQGSVALAEWAATIGLVRGDLWGVAAHRAAASTDAAERASARPDARRALALAPLRSDLWLLLADGSPTAPDGTGPNGEVPDGTASDAALEMAYLTGAGKADEVPARLMAAARSPTLTQGDLKDLVALDIGHVLRMLPDLKPALARAYAAALPANRKFFDDTARAADPDFRFTP